MSLKLYLENEVKNWEFIGAPALMQRFILRNGRAYEPTRLVGRKGKPKECFANATNAVLQRPIRDLPARARWTYAEGYCISRHQPIMAFHHAWIVVDGLAMDPTLNAYDYEYFGLEFPKPNVVEWMKRLGFYGILDTGVGLNIELMFGMDPELKTIVQNVKPHESWLKAKAAQAVMVALAALLVLLPHDLHAQSRVIYGQDGRAIGNIHDDQRGSYTEYGADGRVNARATRQSDGSVTVYGSDGRVKERISPQDPRGRKP